MWNVQERIHDFKLLTLKHAKSHFPDTLKEYGEVNLNRLLGEMINYAYQIGTTQSIIKVTTYTRKKNTELNLVSAGQTTKNKHGWRKKQN